jgi:hypothetical protein
MSSWLAVWVKDPVQEEFCISVGLIIRMNNGRVRPFYSRDAIKTPNMSENLQV